MKRSPLLCKGIAVASIFLITFGCFPCSFGKTVHTTTSPEVGGGDILYVGGGGPGNYSRI